MFNVHDASRDAFMLKGPLAKEGYDRWWHSFTARDAETGEERPFFIEFFVLNPDLGSEDPIYGQLPQNKENGQKPSYLMIKAGCWGDEHMQLHRFYGIDKSSLKNGTPFQVMADECYLDENLTIGKISVSKEDSLSHPEYMSDSGSIEWNLHINKDISFNVGYGASSPIRKADAIDMYWHAEGIRTYYDGEIILNGRKYIVKPENCYGYADKNWGSDFANPWLWLTSDNLTSKMTGLKLKKSAFAIGGGKPKVFFVPHDRSLLGAFYYEGEELEFNFYKFWTGVGTRFTFKESDDAVFWHVKQENRDYVMDTKIKCLKKDMLLMNYESPLGERRHNKLYNGGNGVGKIKLFSKKGRKIEQMDEIIAMNVGCEYGEFDQE